MTLETTQSAWSLQQGGSKEGVGVGGGRDQQEARTATLGGSSSLLASQLLAKQLEEVLDEDDMVPLFLDLVFGCH